jgi:hypothetical protein
MQSCVDLEGEDREKFEGHVDELEEKAAAENHHQLSGHWSPA